MAEFRLDNSLSADEYLELVTAVNNRRNKSNAMLRGLGSLAGVTPTMRTSSGFDTSLRSYSKAKDEEILASIIGHGADHNFIKDGMFNENLFRDWYAVKGLPDKFYEKAVAEFRKRGSEAGRIERLGIAKAAEGRAVETQDDVRGVSSAGMSLANKYVGRWRGQSRQIQQGILAEIQRDIDDSDLPQRLHSAVLEAVRKNLEQGGTMGAAYEKKIEMDRAAQADKDKDLTKSMSIVAANAARDDITAIRGGADYDTVVQTRVGTNVSAGWEKENLEMYHSMMAESGLKPPADTQALKELKEQREIISPVALVRFDEMNTEQQAKTREKYLSLTQLIKAGQRENVLLQRLTEAPLVKRVYNKIEELVEIEDPDFFRRTFGVNNPYELYATFREKTKKMKAKEKEAAAAKFVTEAVRLSGWDADHIYSLIRPELYAVGKSEYTRYRIGG